MLEIGSDFDLSSAGLEGLLLPQERTPGLEDRVQDKRYFSSGRQAIRFCLQDMDLKEKRALLPAYTCRSVIQPFMEEGFSLSFYPLDRNLEISASQLNRLCQDFGAQVLLFHPYFGFDTLVQDVPLDEGVKSIYDATQAFCSPFQSLAAHYVISSIRKWGPFPDGAFCGKFEGEFADRRYFEEDQDFLNLMGKAQGLKARYLEKGEGDKALYRALYGEAYQLLASRRSFYRMGEASLSLYRSFDFSAMGKKRRANYADLLAFPSWSRIGCPLFPRLAEEVPLYFPFLVGGGNRDRLQAFLADRAIYAPVIWPRPPYLEKYMLDDFSHTIYEEILVLPIDQRYGPEAMEKIKDSLDEYVSSSSLEGDAKC